MSITAALKDNKMRDRIFTDSVLLLVFEIFFGIVFFEWRTSANVRMNCFITAGVIVIIAIILIALGMGNKNKRVLVHGFETLTAGIFTFLGYYMMAIWTAPIKIKSISIYVAIPFIVTLIYYIIKIVKESKTIK